MAQKSDLSNPEALEIAHKMQKIRTDSGYYSSVVQKITGANYSGAKALAILISLVNWTLPLLEDRYIVLAAWRLLPQYATIPFVGKRREKLKEDFRSPNNPDSFLDRENGYFDTIAKKCTEFSSEELKVIVDEGLAKYYDAENDHVILPELVLPGSETGNAAAAPDQAADKGKADDKQVKEETPVDPAATPDHAADDRKVDEHQEKEEAPTNPEAASDIAPANEETDGVHDPVADNADPENDSVAVESPPAAFGMENVYIDIDSPTLTARSRYKQYELYPPVIEPISSPQTAISPTEEDEQEDEQKPAKSGKVRRKYLAALIAVVIGAVLISIVYLASGGLDDILKIDFTVKLRARYEGDKTWNDELYHGRVGDVVELQCTFVNDRGVIGTIVAEAAEKLGLNPVTKDVMVTFVLPDNLEYIPDTTTLYNSNHQDGLHMDVNTVATSGINIGAYNINGNSYVRISCRVVNNNLQPGENQLVSFVKVTVQGVVKHDDGVPIHVVY